MDECLPHYCYLLKNGKSRTYNGYTVNPTRRLRQHNSEIRGGAKATCGKGPWEYLLILELNCDKHTALSLEWWIKHPTGTKRRPSNYNSIQGRLNGVLLVLEKPQFKTLNIKIHALPEVLENFTKSTYFVSSLVPSFQCVHREVQTQVQTTQELV